MSIELASVCIIQKVLCLVYRYRASSNCLLLNKQTTMGNVISDSIQQITPFPTSFPDTMVSTHAYSNLLQCPLNYTKSFML